MASTYEPTRAVILQQNGGYGVVAYFGEEAYSEAKKAAGVLQDDDFGKWINANFPNGALVFYMYNTGTAFSVTGTAVTSNANGSTIALVAPTLSN